MKKEIKHTLDILKNGGVIIYPTDTLWGIGCDATDEEAVDKIYKIKQRADSKSMIILVSNWEMLKNYIKKIPAKVGCVIDGAIKPTTVIYNKPKGLAPNVVSSDKTVGIRIVDDEFAKLLIDKFGKPIVSTSANLSGKPAPKNFKDIDQSLLEKVDYVVNLHRDRRGGSASRIVKFDKKGGFKFLRK
ncbi:MAG: threonylcarbamoyl-AMP synthase [Flavobacteriia bacterium]|nr:MAG: threonylcarbamoyl-AMP synthase [Flavobacteriia bacterium]